MSEIQARTFQRVDTAAAWAAADPILGNGEIGVDVTNNQFRVGDGVKHWSQLPPVGATASQIDAMIQAYLAANPPAGGVNVSTEAVSSGVLRVTIGSGTTPAPAPTITTQPQDATTNVGFPRTLTAAATGYTSVKWQSSPDGTTWTDISGATAASYQPPTDTVATTRYRAVFLSSGGSTPTTAASVQVLATLTPTTQPTSQTVSEGAGVTFSFLGTSNGFVRQWQLSTDGGTTWTDISGTSGSGTYNPGATTASMNGYRYRCVATHPTTGNQVVSSVATLTVTASLAPTITTQPTPSSQSIPSDQYIAAGISSAASNSTAVKWQYYQTATTTSSPPRPARGAGWYDLPTGDGVGFWLADNTALQLSSGQNGTATTPNLGTLELVDTGGPFTVRLRAIYSNASGTTTTDEATITFNYTV